MFAEPPVIWFTGLPGSGKTTLARRTAQALRAQGLEVEHLDGDEFRAIFPPLSYTREARDANVHNAAVVARYRQSRGICAIASFVSPYAGARAYARSICPAFVEVYLSTSEAECERRDPKGLYGRARRGEISDFTGVSAPYEVPQLPELTIDTASTSEDDAVNLILDLLKSRGAQL